MENIEKPLHDLISSILKNNIEFLFPALGKLSSSFENFELKCNDGYGLITHKK